MSDTEFESAYETRYVGQLVSELAEARSAAADDYSKQGKSMSLLEEKMFAKSWLRKAIVDLQEKRLGEGAPKLGERALTAIVQGVMDTSFSGARLLRTWQEHPTATNMTAQGTEGVRLELADGTIVMLPAVASSIDEFRASVRACRALSNRPDAPWDHLNHELELVLNDGTRLTAIDFVVPVPFVTLRRPTLKIISLEDLVANGTMSDRLGVFLAAAVRSKLRILVGGSMNSGKTVTLRALAAALPTDSALVTAESSGELLLKDGAGDPYPNFITPLEARRAGADGHGEVSLNNLIENAQRMSPTCVIVGEVRGQEAQALSKALRQGYQVMSTIHGISAADSVSNAALYLEEYDGVPAEAALKRMVGSVDLVIFMEQVEGRRIVAEVTTPVTAHGGVVQSEIVYDGTLMYPIPDVLKKPLARFGYGDDF